MVAKKALLILANGSEEMEAVITVDVLIRSGVEVTVAGLTGTAPVKCSRDVKIVPDQALTDVENISYDVVVLPGGLKGAENLAKDSNVGSILQKQEKEGRLIAAICAAPTALKSHKICIGKKLTSYPSKKSEMEEGGLYSYSEDRVVTDGQLITSRGPGTAFEFSLAIVEKLIGKDKANEIAQQMLVR